jgi:hypothetical protein
MREGRNIMRRCSIMLMAILIWLTGCASADMEEREGVHRYKRIHWKEQMRLSTGEVIVIERGERRRLAYGGQLPFGWLFDEAWLEAKLPGIGTTRWEGALSPLILDVTPAGEWYLLGAVYASRGRKDYRLPEHKRYVAFKLRNSSWQRISFTEFPDSFQPNLLVSTGTLLWEKEIQNGMLVDFEMKHRADSDRTLDKSLRRIDRSRGE